MKTERGPPFVVALEGEGSVRIKDATVEDLFPFFSSVHSGTTAAEDAEEAEAASRWMTEDDDKSTGWQEEVDDVAFFEVVAIVIDSRVQPIQIHRNTLYKNPVTYSNHLSP